MRKATPEDLMFLFNLKNEKVVLQWSFDQNPVDLETHKKWFAKKISDPLTALYIVENDGQAIGQVRFDVGPDNSAVISIDISSAYRGKGYGTEAIKESLDVLFQSHPEVKTVNSFIFLANTASQRAFTKAGFGRAVVLPDHPDRVQMAYERSS